MERLIPLILRNSNIGEIFDKQPQRQIVCFGSGEQFKEMLTLFSEFPWHDRMFAVLDNDPDKDGQYISVNGHNYKIMLPQKFLSCPSIENCCLIICNSYYQDVIKQLDATPQFNNMDCYVYSLTCCKSLQTEIPIKKRGEFLIPPHIHYCWFGKKEIPDAFKGYMETWRELCPEYKIIEWNEDNCDINETMFTREAYQSGKYGFVPDYFRLKIIYEHGGIYLDTDVSLLKCLDDLRREAAFCGMERPGVVALGLGFGAMKGNDVIRRLMERYLSMEFIADPSRAKEMASPKLQTEDLMSLGLQKNNRFQKVASITVFPVEVLSPQHFLTGETEITDYSYSLHHWAGSWLSANAKQDNEDRWRLFEKLSKRVEADLKRG